MVIDAWSTGVLCKLALGADKAIRLDMCRKCRTHMLRMLRVSNVLLLCVELTDSSCLMFKFHDIIHSSRSEARQGLC